MKIENKRPPLRMLMLVTTSKKAKKAAALFQGGAVPSYYQFYGRGTAHSEMKDMLGLGNTEKTVLMSIMPKIFADRLMQKMYKELKLNTPNSGIVFSLIMSGGSSMVVNKLNELQDESSHSAGKQETARRGERDYVLIMAIVDQGYSEEVMDAARSAGAGGGTVFHARQAVNEETMKFWGIQIQPEREITIILAAREDKLAIMKEIGEKCGVHSEARGIVFSLPVDSAIGLE